MPGTQSVRMKVTFISAANTELPTSVLKKPSLQAEEFGFLGNNIFGTDFNFHIHVHAGAGAYVCGEETALIESIEGKRGEPRSRPPYPITNGLWNKPTLVNNVETLANIPPILRNGAEWYKSLGTPSSPGTKVYTIMGNVNFRGVIEVPMGITLREVINIYAKGMKPGSTLKLAQTGGSSGSIIPAALQDTPMDFESFRKAGVSLGSGALLDLRPDTPALSILSKFLLQFFRFESCGKCTPCRVGTQRIYEIVDRLSQGQGELADLDKALDLIDEMERMSNCGLGQTAGTAFRGMLTHFRDEAEAHIRTHECPTGVCSIEENLKRCQLDYFSVQKARDVRKKQRVCPTDGQTRCSTTPNCIDCCATNITRNDDICAIGFSRLKCRSIYALVYAPLVFVSRNLKWL